MDFSKGSFLLFLLILIFHAPFPIDVVFKLANFAPVAAESPEAQPAAAPTTHKSDHMIAEVCSATREYTRCFAIFESIPQAYLAKDYIELAKVYLEYYAIRKAIEGQNIIKQVLETNKDPAIELCANEYYEHIVNTLKNSRSELDSDPGIAGYDASVSLDDILYCKNALIEDKINIPSISAVNDEIGFVCAIAREATIKF